MDRLATSCWTTAGPVQEAGSSSSGMEVPEPSGLHPHTHRAASEVSGLGALSSGEGMRARGLQGGCVCERERKLLILLPSFLSRSSILPTLP